MSSRRSDYAHFSTSLRHAANVSYELPSSGRLLQTSHPLHPGETADCPQLWSDSMAETTFRRVNATWTIAAAIAFLLACAQPVFGEDPVMTTEGGEDFTSLSLEDLMKVEITSVSKQKQTVAQAPAAV